MRASAKKLLNERFQQALAMASVRDLGSPEDYERAFREGEAVGASEDWGQPNPYLIVGDRSSRENVLMTGWDNGWWTAMKKRQA